MCMQNDTKKSTEWRGTHTRMSWAKEKPAQTKPNPTNNIIILRASRPFYSGLFVEKFVFQKQPTHKIHWMHWFRAIHQPIHMHKCRSFLWNCGRFLFSDVECVCVCVSVRSEMIFFSPFVCWRRTIMRTHVYQFMISLSHLCPERHSHTHTHAHSTHEIGVFPSSRAHIAAMCERPVRFPSKINGSQNGREKLKWSVPKSTKMWPKQAIYTWARVVKIKISLLATKWLIVFRCSTVFFSSGNIKIVVYPRFHRPSIFENMILCHS